LIAVGKEQLPKNTNNLVENDFTLEPIRRGEGVWTTHEVENVARLMLDERDFREIPYAGSLILKNTKGEKSFSEDHRLFVDSPLHIETGPLSNINEDWGKIGATNIRETGSVARFVSDRVPPQESQNQTRFQLRRVIINPEASRDNSDFYIKFIIAKEVMNVRAFQMVADYIATFAEVASQQNASSRDAYILYLFKRGGINRYSPMPFPFMADMWAHYLMTLDFLKAKEQGRLDEADLRDLAVIDISAGYFLRNGILSKGENGYYEWTNDAEAFYEHWIESAARSHAAFTGVSPPKDP